MADAVQEQPINLNDAQIMRILEVATAGKMYEGEPSPDPEVRRKDAATLIWHARRAANNGNTSPIVTELCFIADADQAPPTTGAEAFAPQPAQEAAPAAPAPVANGSEAEYTPEMLQKMIDALRPNATVAAVKAEIDRLEALLQQGGASAQAAQPPQAQPAPTPDAQPPQQAQVPSGSAQPMPVPPPVGQQLPEGALDASGQPRPLADAPDPPVVQATQSGQEGAPPAAQAPAQDGDRPGLEAQLSGSILMAYGKTFADVAQLSVEELRGMIANPDGPPPPAAPVSPERDALEGQVSGPMLKAHGKGRKQIPDMSDEELKWMVEHPEGPRWPGPAGGPTPSQEAPPPAPVSAAAQVAQQSAEMPVVQASAAGFVEPNYEGVDALIAQERFPLPPEVEAPPVLPFDMSKTSDDELRSLHAQFHAVLARVNWVIAGHKDEIFGLKRALAAQEAVVRSNLPKTAEGKRVTNDDKDAMVASDETVIRYLHQLADQERPLIKLETIAENARSTCARASREYSMRRGEELPVSRGER